MGIDRERRALAHREQAGDCIDLAIGEDHARNRAMSQLSVGWMQLRRRDQLLAQIGGGVDEKPVHAVAGKRDRGLCADQSRIGGPCLPADRTSAIPLRNTAACGRARTTMRSMIRPPVSTQRW